MLKQKLKFFFISATALLSACATQQIAQQDIAKDFWTAMAADKLDKAKAYVKDSDSAKISDFDIYNIEKINLKTHQEFKGQTSIPTAMTLLEGGRQKTISFGTIIEKENGVWKIDLNGTGEAMKKALESNRK